MCVVLFHKIIVYRAWTLYKVLTIACGIHMLVRSVENNYHKMNDYVTNNFSICNALFINDSHWPVTGPCGRNMGIMDPRATVTLLAAIMDPSATVGSRQWFKQCFTGILYTLVTISK